MSDICKRFAQVLNEVYRSDMVAMAQALGMDKTAIFRLQNGQRTPRRTVLMLLAHVSNVDLDWLENGGSEKVRFKVSDSPMLPVATEPQETPPSSSVQWRQCLPFHKRSACYWLQSKNVDGFEGKTSFSLVECVPNRTPQSCDVGQLRVVKSKDVLELSRIRANDVGSKKQIVGLVSMLEIDTP